MDLVMCCSLQEVSEVERKRGAALLARPLTVRLQYGASDLCLDVSHLGDGWTLKQQPHHQVMGWSYTDMQLFHSFVSSLANFHVGLLEALSNSNRNGRSEEIASRA